MNISIILDNIFSIDNINTFYIIDNDIKCIEYNNHINKEYYIDNINKIISKDNVILLKINNILDIFNKVIMNETELYYDIDKKIMIDKKMVDKKYNNDNYKVTTSDNRSYIDFIKYYEKYINSIRNISKYINYKNYNKIKKNNNNNYYYIEYEKYIIINDDIYNYKHYKCDKYKFITRNEYIFKYYNLLFNINYKDIIDNINLNNNNYYDLDNNKFFEKINNKKYINNDIKICSNSLIIFNIFIKDYNKNVKTINTNNILKINKTIPKKIRTEIWNSSNNECYCCSDIITYDTFEVGHIKSRMHGGDNDVNNLKAICFGCNRSMSSYHMYEYMLTYNKNIKKIPVNIEYCYIYGFKILKDKAISILEKNYLNNKINVNEFNNYQSLLNNSRKTIKERLEIIESLNLNLHIKEMRNV